MDELKLDVNEIISMYSEELTRLQHDNIILKATIEALKRELKHNGGDVDGKVDAT